MDEMRIFLNSWERLSFHSTPLSPEPLLAVILPSHHPSTQHRRKGQALGEDGGLGVYRTISRFMCGWCFTFVALFLPWQGLCAPSKGVSLGEVKIALGVCFHQPSQESSGPEWKPCFSAAAAELKVAQSELWGSICFPYMYPAVAQRPCWVASATAVSNTKKMNAIFIYLEIFLIQIILGAQNAISLL